MTDRGRHQARRAAASLRRSGFLPDACFCSRLARAVHTAQIVADILGPAGLRIQREWRLNERHYGALQGLKPAEAAARFGLEQVRAWQRSFTEIPPPLDDDDPRHPAQLPEYADVDPGLLPSSESIRCAQQRVLSWYETRLRPLLADGRRVLVVSHANLIKALIQRLESLPEAELRRLAIPVGVPVSYQIGDGLRLVGKRYLGYGPTSLVAGLLAPRLAGGQL